MSLTGTSEKARCYGIDSEYNLANFMSTLFLGHKVKDFFDDDRCGSEDIKTLRTAILVLPSFDTTTLFLHSQILPGTFVCLVSSSFLSKILSHKIYGW
jgi:hypothetical protein